MKENVNGNMNVFETFNAGQLVLPNHVKSFAEVDWSKHAVFEGVELKHIITAKETDGVFSFHLVRIAPNCSIGEHVHENQVETHEVIAGDGICVNFGETLPYESGTISIFQAGVKHEVRAGKDGLYLFAKFMPALC